MIPFEITAERFNSLTSEQKVDVRNTVVKLFSLFKFDVKETASFLGVPVRFVVQILSFPGSTHLASITAINS